MPAYLDAIRLDSNEAVKIISFTARKSTVKQLARSQELTFARQTYCRVGGFLAVLGVVQLLVNILESSGSSV